MSLETHQVYFTGEQLLEALADLGPPATRAEGLVFTAAQLFARVIGPDRDEALGSWVAYQAGSPAGALQAGRPIVELQFHERDLAPDPQEVTK